MDPDTALVIVALVGFACGCLVGMVLAMAANLENRKDTPK
jgi:hypothetical protein